MLYLNPIQENGHDGNWYARQEQEDWPHGSRVVCISRQDEQCVVEFDSVSSIESRTSGWDNMNRFEEVKPKREVIMQQCVEA